MLGWLGFGAHAFFGIAVDYLLAAPMIGAGLYVAFVFEVAQANPFYRLLRPLRWLGLALAGAGLCVAAFAFGKSVTAADCISAARLASVQSELTLAQDSLKRWKDTAELRSEQLRELSRLRGESNARVADWQTQVEKLSVEARRARAAAPDDDRRLCGIVRGKAAGC